ncbi:MAG: hypothetical protein IH851_02860 [Armatimonadetes bacterium]|nr:hypothetical protein [Armatimonadota bacterium]
MIKIRMLTLAACVILVSAATAVAEQTARIQWKPKVGDVTKYRMKMNLAVDPAMGVEEVEVALTITDTVKEIKGDGKIVIEESQSDFSLMVDGLDMSEMMADMMNMKVTSIFLPNGTLVSIETNMPEMVQNRTVEAMAFIFPDQAVRPGETWTYTRAGDSNKGTFAAETVFKYEKTEKVDKWLAHKIIVTFRETEGALPMSSTATIWLSADNGDLVKGVIDIKNMEFGPGMTADSAQIQLTRIE